MSEVSEVLAGQRLASQHHPSTWTEEAQFDLELWTYHDAHHEPVRYGVCPFCCEQMEEFQAMRAAEQIAVYDLAKELGL